MFIQLLVILVSVCSSLGSKGVDLFDATLEPNIIWQSDSICTQCTDTAVFLPATFPVAS